MLPVVALAFLGIFAGYTVATKTDNARIERVSTEKIIAPISEPKNQKEVELIVTENKEKPDEAKHEDVKQFAETNNQSIVADQKSKKTDKPSTCGYSNKWGNLDILKKPENAQTWPSQKMYDALVFADMINEVNSNKTTLFAVNDYGFSLLTQTQKDYIYESPQNMRSVLKWQVIEGCQTLPEFGADPFSFSSHGGTLNYVHGGPPFVNGERVVMWNFYTANGVVNYTSGFFDPTLASIE